MNCRAFNLFTALVAFILIILTMLLVSSMIMAADKTKATISDIEQSASLEAVADLARADSIQVFNYGIRFRIEEWLSNPSNYYTLLPEKSWNDIVQDYACAYFGSCGDNPNAGKQFADITANTMIGLLETGITFGQYDLSLIKKDKQELFTALDETIQVSVKEKKFFDVIGCPRMKSTSGNPEDPNECFDDYIGTFYVNLLISKIPDATYEKLPQILVMHRATGDFAKKAILPKADFRIYIPLRVFRAIAKARQYAETSFFSSSGDYSKMALGMCDSSMCMPRSNPLGTPSGSNVNGYLCPGTSRSVFSQVREKILTGVQVSVPGKGTISYDPDNDVDTAEALRVFAKSKLVSDAANDPALAESSDKLDVVKDTAINSRVFDADFFIKNFDSKAIYPNMDFVDSMSNIDWASCARLTGIKARLRFQENNPEYKVNKNNDNIYTIDVRDQGRYDKIREEIEPQWCFSNCFEGGPDFCNYVLSCTPQPQMPTYRTAPMPSVPHAPPRP